MSEVDVQRLFSTFAHGWPGTGLLLQRILIATLLLREPIAELSRAPISHLMSHQILAGLAGILLLAGLWTPIVGVLIAGIELWAVFTGIGDLRISVILLTLGGTIAMIGPGSWSLDARLFGRKRFATSRRRSSEP